jgi:trk system potassium uptake protein TrkH
MRDILERPANTYVSRRFVVVDENTDVARAVKHMQEQQAESIIVMKGSLAVGIVTDSDIIDKVVMKGEDSDTIAISQVMSSPVISMSSGGTVKQALQQMRVHRVKRILITDTTGIVGIVTQPSLASIIRTSVLERALKKVKKTITDEYKPVLGNLGVLLQFSGVLLVVPALVGTALGEGVSIIGVYLEVVGLSFAGFFLMSYGERGQMNLKQASIFIVTTFIVMSLLGALPYIYLNPFQPGIDPNSLFVNSLFESASGFTTTGLSVITEPETLPESFTFYRAYTQWVGGLSFVYLVMILFFPPEKLSAMKSVLGGGMLRFKEFIVTLVVIFSLYTVVLVVLTMLSAKTDTLNSISLILSTIISGGFVPTSTIISPDNLEILVVTSGGMILSALPFAFHYYIFYKKGLISKKTVGPEVATYLVLMALAVPIFFILASSSPGMNFGTAAFHTISASTTTGFQYLNLQAIAPAAKGFLIIIMLVGGAAFSTAGGIKVGRFVILYHEISRRIGRKAMKESSSYSLAQPAYTSISSVANPQRLSEHGNGNFLEQLREEYRRRDFTELVQKRDEVLKIIRELLKLKLVREILLVIGLYISVSLITGAVLSNATGIAFEDSMFESVSALTNTGLSVGVTSLALDSLSKLMLTAVMIVGRFEIIVIFYIFFRSLRK